MAIARAAVECAYGGEGGGSVDLVVLSGKETGWISRRAGVVIVRFVDTFV